MFVYFKQSLEICPYIMFLCLSTLCPWTSGGPSPALFSFDGLHPWGNLRELTPRLPCTACIHSVANTPAHRACKWTPLNLLLAPRPTSHSAGLRRSLCPCWRQNLFTVVFAIPRPLCLPAARRPYESSPEGSPAAPFTRLPIRKFS